MGVLISLDTTRESQDGGQTFGFIFLRVKIWILVWFRKNMLTDHTDRPYFRPADINLVYLSESPRTHRSGHSKTNRWTVSPIAAMNFSGVSDWRGLNFPLMVALQRKFICLALALAQQVFLNWPVSKRRLNILQKTWEKQFTR